jgi:ubiquinone/menaquinone biosynthesis C-methylase UbiE
VEENRVRYEQGFVLTRVGGQMKEVVIATQSQRTYLPAAGRDSFLPAYDLMTRLMGADKARRALLDQAQILPGHRVLDVGCGTGSLTIRLKQLYPDAVVVGLDPDPKALARARHKAARAAVSIQVDQGFGDELPYPDASFDRVFSSLMFHHVSTNDKGKTVREVRRVLKPGGEFHMLDFEGPEKAAHGLLARLLHSSDRLKDNSESRVLSFMTEAGFADPKKIGSRAMLFGNIAYYRAIALGNKDLNDDFIQAKEFSGFTMEHDNHRNVHGMGLGILKGKKHILLVAVLLMIIALVILHAVAANSIYKAGVT